MLRGDDPQIYAFLRKHGRAKRAEKGIVIRYRGDPVYNSCSKTFAVDGRELSARDVKILSRKG